MELIVLLVYTEERPNRAIEYSYTALAEQLV